MKYSISQGDLGDILVLKPGHFSVLIWTTFVFLTLVISISSQFTTLSSVLATSSNNNEKKSNEDLPQESASDEESSNNDQSSDSQSDQDNQCSNERIEGPSFIDDDGCPVPCPTLEDQSDNIPDGCPVPTLTTTTTDSQETYTEPSQQNIPQNNSQNPVNTQNTLRPDDATNDVFLDLQLEGVKELPRDSTIFSANSYLKIFANFGNFSPSTDLDSASAEMAKTSICVETISESDYNRIQIHPASPQCMFGPGVETFTVYPGSVDLTINTSLQITYYVNTCNTTIKPLDSKSCRIEFTFSNPPFVDTQIQGGFVDRPGITSDAIGK